MAQRGGDPGCAQRASGGRADDPVSGIDGGSLRTSPHRRERRGDGQCDVSGTVAQGRIHGAPARGAVRRVRAADHVDLPIRGQGAWRITLSPPVPGFAPWERTSPDLHIAAAVLAALPPDKMIAIRQVGDFGLSLALSLSMPRSKAGR